MKATQSIRIEVRPNMDATAEGPLTVIQDGMAMGVADNFVIELPTSQFGEMRLKSTTTITYTIERGTDDIGPREERFR